MVKCGRESFDVSLYMEEGEFEDVSCESVVSCNNNTNTEINITNSSFYSSTSICDIVDNLDPLPSTPTSHDEVFFYEQCELDDEFMSQELDLVHRRIIFGISKFCALINPNQAPTRGEIKVMMHEAFDAEATLLTERKAIADAMGFEFPSTVTDTDMIKFESVGWDFTALARLRISELAADRISERSIMANIDPADPDLPRLLKIAAGVRVITSPDFVPNLSPPPLRAKYVTLHQPINQSMFKNYQAGKTILLPVSSLQHIKDAHFSLVHCNLEASKLRVITDSSNAPEGTWPLNSVYVRDNAREEWGTIVPVDIETLIIKTKLFMDANPSGTFAIFKMDMADAFSLFTMHADDVRLLGFLLTDDILQFEITGSFGKTDYPYVFNVFTNVVRREATKRIVQAVMDMYVDDVMGCTLVGQLTNNISIIKSFIEAVWGIGSVSDRKTLTSETMLEWIGYDVNIIEQTVRISKKNRIKFIRILFRVDEDKGISVRDIMRLASYASRYVKICRVMTPYSCHLYNTVCWMSNLQAIVCPSELSPNFRVALTLWRCVITLMELRRDDQRFFRTFQSFLPLQNCQFRVEFDASLTGAGIVVSRLLNDIWTPVRVISLSLPFQDILSSVQYQSSLQNACEFIAAVVGLYTAIRMGACNGQILLLGDSKTALHWSETWKFRSGPSNNTAIVYVALSLKFNLRFDDTVFVRGIDNVTCDKLSRGIHPAVLGFQSDLYCDDEDLFVTHILSLCTPSKESAAADHLVSTWVDAASLAEAISLECLQGSL